MTPELVLGLPGEMNTKGCYYCKPLPTLAIAVYCVANYPDKWQVVPTRSKPGQNGYNGWLRNPTLGTVRVDKEPIMLLAVIHHLTITHGGNDAHEPTSPSRTDAAASEAVV